MTNLKRQGDFVPGRGYSREDWDEVSEAPALTEDDFKRARPFADAFPDLAESMRTNGVEVIGDPRIGGTAVAIDPRVVAYFKQQGPDWEIRLNLALRKLVGL